MQLNPETDLELIRHFRAPPDRVWRCWTEASLLEQWFAPKPVVTRDVVLELHPGGSFRTTMDIPGHGSVTGHGCVLHVEPMRRLVWTDLMEGAFRPANAVLGFTAIIALEPQGEGTLYRAVAMHRGPEQCQEHSRMGFHEGWGTAASQLDALALTL